MRTRLLMTIILAALVLAVVVGWRDTMRVTLTFAEVPAPGLTRPVTVLHTSDLHGATFGEGQARVASLLEGTHYDAAVINGDHLSSTRGDIDPALDLLAVLREHTDIVFVTRGNHDTAPAIDTLVAHGAVPLRADDPPVPFAVDAGNLLAVPSITAGDVPTDTAVALAVGHYPLTGEVTRARTGAGATTTLYLFGHTHGGQIRLPLLGALWAPGEVGADGLRPARTAVENFFPELRGRTIAGLGGADAVHTHISRGLGTQGIRLRLLAPAEMTVITLMPVL
ncbi:MAG: metallophosphoesterase [Coriobacteriia bacterium]|nr:metallophosphoesterase [Coriobacteriia bacterium]